MPVGAQIEVGLLAHRLGEAAYLLNVGDAERVEILASMTICHQIPEAGAYMAARHTPQPQPIWLNLAPAQFVARLIVTRTARIEDLQLIFAQHSGPQYLQIGRGRGATKPLGGVQQDMFARRLDIS